MEKLYFTDGRYKEDFLKRINCEIFNFLNSHDIYQFKKEPIFRKSISSKGINFIDGFIISVFLSLTNLKKVSRYRGPEFTRDFFEKEKGKNKKMLFIGPSKNDVDFLLKRFPYLRKKDLSSYELPFIKRISFSENEIKKITKIINDKKIDYVWMGVGCPKQNILSHDLFRKTKNTSYFNVGAALDFLLEKKKEPGGFVQKVGMEWFYRLITDYNHSKKKVWRSLIASLFYLPFITRLKNQK